MVWKLGSFDLQSYRSLLVICMKARLKAITIWMIHSPSSSFITFSEVWLTSLIALSMLWFWLGNPYMASGTLPSATTWRRSSSERLDKTGGSKCTRWWIQNNPIHLHWYSLFTKKLYHHNTVHWRILCIVVSFWPLVSHFSHYILVMINNHWEQ